MQDIYKPCCDCYMALKECPCPHRGYCLADDNGGICIHSHLSENNFEMKKKREIECDFHGKIKWKYHLICRSCKRVFDRKKSNFIVEKRNNTCYCGEKFAPVKSLKEDPEKKEIFSAAPICPECYKREIKKKRGFE